MNKTNLKYRLNRMNQLNKKWNLKMVHPLILKYKIPDELFSKFKINLKLYISKALNIDFIDNDKKFLKMVEKKRSYRKNVTPNGAIVPKRDYNLEYNLVLKEWCEIVRNLTKKNPLILNYFRMTPNIRVKFGQDLKDNIKRGLNTSHPHSDAWVEGPWGMNCFFPVLGDYMRNNLKFYEPNIFDESFLTRAPSYLDMQWVMKNYKEINFIPKLGNLYISDYAMIHNTHRKKNSKVRVSIDSTVFVDKYNTPPKSRIKEYRNKIPYLGVEEIIDSGQYQDRKYSEKKGVYSHYTSKSLRSIKL